MNLFRLKTNMKHYIGFILLFCLLWPLFLLLQFTSLASAAFNPEINYQGKLLTASSSAVADGTYSIVFRLYTVPTAGSNIWTETQSVSVQSGLFSVMLGTTTSLAAKLISIKLFTLVSTWKPMVK